MTDTYTIRVEDQVSGPVQKMIAAQARFAVTSASVARAMREDSKFGIALARDLNALAGAELRAAKAAVSAAQAVDKLSASSDKTSKASKRAASESKGFSYTLNGLASAASNAAFHLAEKLVGGLLDIGKSLYDTAVYASRTKQAMTVLFGGVDAGAAVMKQATALSNKYGIGLEIVTEALIGFKGAGFDLAQSDYLVKWGADLKAIGRTSEQVEIAFTNIRKIQSQGFLQGDELNALGEANILSVSRVYDILAKQFGKTKDEIVKMQSQRKLLAGDVENAIVKATTEQAGEVKIGVAGDKGANGTIGGISDRIASNVQNAVTGAVSAAEPALVKGGQAILAGVLGSESSGKGLTEQLTAALVRVGAGLEEFGPKIPALVENLGKVASAVGALVEKIASFSSDRGVAATGRLGFSEDSIPGKILGFNGDKLHGIATDLWTSITQGRGDPYDQGSNIGKGLANGIADSAPSVATAAAGIAQGAIDASKETAQIHSPSRIFAEQGAFMAEGLALGIEDQANLAARASQAMVEQAIAESAGVASRGGAAMAAGTAAGDTFNSSKSAGSTIGAVHFDVHLGGGAGADSDAVQQLRDFVEVEFAALLERAAEGSGA